MMLKRSTRTWKFLKGVAVLWVLKALLLVVGLWVLIQHPALAAYGETRLQKIAGATATAEVETSLYRLEGDVSQVEVRLSLIRPTRQVGSALPTGIAIER